MFCQTFVMACFAALAIAMPATAQTPVGVAECDSFISKYEACVSKNVPANQQQGLFSQLGQLRSAWRQAAQDPTARATLPQQCTDMAQRLGQQLSGYGCRF
jgi:hypothetical protein